MEDRSRRRARLVLIVGVLIAILAGAGTYVLSSGSKAEAPAAVATTDVLVAVRDLPARSALTAADVKVQKYPGAEESYKSAVELAEKLPSEHKTSAG